MNAAVAAEAEMVRGRAAALYLPAFQRIAQSIQESAVQPIVPPAAHPAAHCESAASDVSKSPAATPPSTTGVKLSCNRFKKRINVESTLSTSKSHRESSLEIRGIGCGKVFESETEEDA